ncbi:hypothetical protein QE441_002871 [Chryseobacterium sp. SORGH_AS909]|uniref:Uncharacterized protein n=1 Tax=Chryseobacterium camelliae TaxID=1265445 RepID=A0ABU0TFK2_9FLAO|nr:hypothetical protein [Chryseobacterium camelliae]MDQ1099729.1 hypothetical protein [Chryseobacterium sp. SORGH_AS_1048]MDR6087077.1 hypothetical protein [Chryseobacterium sp. SORGH_AS_0909]MDR6131450.1 hypothetical protein [Chryseobacterium sp. SORGH_AS_1175]MDT3406408.1 hypothetical protein [Pseudacidovorax intermedius]
MFVNLERKGLSQDIVVANSSTWAKAKLNDIENRKTNPEFTTIRFS